MNKIILIILGIFLFANLTLADVQYIPFDLGNPAVQLQRQRGEGVRITPPRGLGDDTCAQTAATGAGTYTELNVGPNQKMKVCIFQNRESALGGNQAQVSPADDCQNKCPEEGRLGPPDAFGIQHCECFGRLDMEITGYGGEGRAWDFKYEIPGGADDAYKRSPAAYVARLYQFGLMIVGLIAMGSLVFGAVKYILSAGNIVTQQDARDQMTSAIWGILLLLGAYLILYTINPDMVKLKDPGGNTLNLEAIRGTGQTTSGTPNAPVLDDSRCQSAGGTCQIVGSAPCPGGYLTGYCAGGADRKCCAPLQQ